MTWLRRALMLVLGHYAQGRLLNGVRRRGLAAYFRVVNGARRVLVTLVFINLFLQLMVTSLLALAATLAFTFIPDPATRLYVLAGLFGFTFVVPLLAGAYILSESFWLKMSGAAGLIDEPADE